MKIKLIIWFLLLFGTIARAQDGKTIIRTIEVIGEAEKEVVPDQIYLQITLKEYKDGSRKVTINTLEKQLVNAVAKLDLPAENLTVNNVYGYNWNWKKRKAEDFLATKSFKLLMPEVKKINSLMNMLDEEGVNSVNINEYKHSQMEKIQADLKIEAIRAARQKAAMLLEAIGEELGGAVTVSENSMSDTSPVLYRQRSFESKSLAVEDAEYSSDLGFKKIKLKSSIRVVFAIK
ncbi:MAG: SIMPL domain-containing protein [Cyclobacteriaceae bacterium]